MIRTEHREEKWSFPFVQYGESDANNPKPLIIQLHGAGERGYGKEDLDIVERHGFSELLETNDYDCIVVMPHCRPETFWVAQIDGILKFIHQLKAEYNIDEDRVCLTGMSMGGYGTWYTAMARPDLFSCIVPVCGGGMAWNAEVLTMPIQVFHGADDGLVSTIQSDEMVEALKKCGANVTYTRMEGVDHNAWDYTYDDKLMKWILSQKR